MTKRLTGAATLIAMFLMQAAFFPAAFAQEKDLPPVSPTPDSIDRWFTWVLDGESRGPGRPRQLWLNGEVLVGFTRGGQMPTLATTSATGTPRELAKEGESGTHNIFGGFVNDNLRPGFRASGGWWFEGDSNLGAEFGVMFLSGQRQTLFAGSDAYPIIGRPFFDANDGTLQSLFVAYPGLSNGSLDIEARFSNFTSASCALTERVYDLGWFRTTALFGYRMYRYDEYLTIRQTVQPTDPNFIPGTMAVTSDYFNTRNEFHGLDMGIRQEYFWDRFSLELLLKVAVGDVRREVNIHGDQVVSIPGLETQSYPAGILAVENNSGNRISHDWKVLPEAGATLQWALGPNFNVRLGYSFLLLNGISRVGDQIDRTVNPDLFAPALGVNDNVRRPAFLGARSDMWIQTINVGFLWNY